MAEQVLDLRTGTAILHQNRRWLAKVSAAGLVLGMAYAILAPASLASTALVLLPATAGTQGAPADAVTQMRIVLSTTVLDAAGRSVKPAMTGRQVSRRVAVDDPTPQLIQIVVRGSDPGKARRLCQAVADAYIASLQANARTVTAATLTDLRTRETVLSQQVKTLQDEIDATTARQRAADPASANGVREAQLLAQLSAEQANTSLQLDKVKDSLFTYGSLGGASGAATTIIQPASPAIGPGLLNRLTIGSLVGALLAVLGAVTVVLVRARRDPRVRSRDDLADAVGSSVLAGVRSHRQQSIGEWSALLENYEVGPVEAWAFRQVLRSLAAVEPRGLVRVGEPRATGRVDHPRSLAVLSLSGDLKALAVGPQLAVFAASLGIVTRLVVAAGDGTAASLRAACSAERGSEPRPGLDLAAFPPADGVGHPAAADAPDFDRPGKPDSTGTTGAEAAGTTDAGWPPTVIKPRSVVDKDVISRIAAVLGRKPPPTSEIGTESSTGQGRPNGFLAPARTLTGDPDGALQVEAGPERPVDLTIVLGVLDRGRPLLDGVPGTQVALLAISPGVANRAELARVAVALDDAGRRVDGIVVADPDASDRTTGRHTLDQRARHLDLPVRMTGIGPVAQRVGERGKTR